MITSCCMERAEMINAFDQTDDRQTARQRGDYQRDIHAFHCLSGERELTLTM